MSHVEPIFAVRGVHGGPERRRIVRGLKQLEHLLRHEFVDEAADDDKAERSEAVRRLSSGAANDLDDQQKAAAYLGVDITQVSAADLDDATWARLVWQACRDGGTWWEDDDTSLRISDASDVAGAFDASDVGSAGTTGTPRSGAPRPGLSLVDPALPTDRAIRAVATCGSLDTVRIFDGQIDTWTSIRDLVSDARTRHAQAEVKRHHERYERVKAELELARRTRARAVQGALATKVPLERLQTLLGVKRAQVYAIASSASDTPPAPGAPG